MIPRPITSQQVGDYYDRLATYYSLVWGGNLHVGYWPPEAPDLPLAVAQDNLTDLLISRTQVQVGQKVLDVGCGMGRPGVRLAEKTGCDVLGITISATQAQEANSYAQTLGFAQRVDFQCVDAMCLPFEAASFDAVWAFESLFHMPDRAAVLRQIARVLRVGGRLVITDSYDKVPFTPQEAQLAYQGFQTSSFITPDEYRTLLAALNVNVVEFCDISSNIRQSFSYIMSATQQRAEALSTVYGEGFVAQMQQVGPVFDTLMREKLAYFMIVAEKVA